MGNQLIKVTKTKGHVTFGSSHLGDEDKFNLVVCQADKRIVCHGEKPALAKSNGGRPAFPERACNQSKTVKAVAVCNFTIGLWNLGGTCISNHLWNMGHDADCPDNKTSAAVPEAIAQIWKKCNNATLEDHHHCTRLAMV